MYRSTITHLLFILPFFTFGQDSLLVEELKSNVHLLKFEDSKLSGEGLGFFKKEASASPFFLIGESHGMAEIPLFTAALFGEIKPFGYKYLATETGSYTAKLIQKMASGKDWETAFGQHYKKYPFSIPFYNWKEECGILQAVLKNNKSGEQVIWGLDQEFAASFRMFFKKLEKEAATVESKKLATYYYEMAERTFKESLESKDPRKSFMAVMKAGDFKKLKAAFGGQLEALDLLKELEESLQIYGMWFTGDGHESNYLRAEMMKRHFMKYYQKAKAGGGEVKVLFKFGASHIYRGLNGLNIPDIGSFVSELASQEGKKTFHLYVVGRKGTQNAYNPFSQSEADKKMPHDASEDFGKIDLSAALNAVPEDEWAVIDLRPAPQIIAQQTIEKCAARHGKNHLELRCAAHHPGSDGLH